MVKFVRFVEKGQRKINKEVPDLPVMKDMFITLLDIARKALVDPKKIYEENGSLDIIESNSLYPDEVKGYFDR